MIGEVHLLSNFIESSAPSISSQARSKKIECLPNLTPWLDKCLQRIVTLGYTQLLWATCALLPGNLN